MAVIDLNVTSTCNLGCTYCSEGFECGLSTIFEENTYVTIDNIQELMDKIKDPKKEIYFWGGEPFINWQFCKEVMEKYKHDENYSFFFYTNGMYLKKYLKELVEFNEVLGQRRLSLQVSYDGKAVNDITRPDKAGNPSSEMVKANYLAAKNAGLNMKMKSVLTADHFHLIFEAFLDVIQLDKNYFPTPDLYSRLTEEEFMPKLDALQVGLGKIAKYIYKNDLPAETFGWFTQSRALCASGINYISVDLNGDMSPCHGCMYKDSHDHIIGNIHEVEDIDSLIAEKSAEYKDALKNQPLDCLSCDAMFCMKCNSATYEKSEKEDYWDKWSDHTANWQTCKVFKTNEIVHHALRVAKNSYVAPTMEDKFKAESCTA